MSRWKSSFPFYHSSNWPSVTRSSSLCYSLLKPLTLTTNMNNIWSWLKITPSNVSDVADNKLAHQKFPHLFSSTCNRTIPVLQPRRARWKSKPGLKLNRERAIVAGTPIPNYVDPKMCCTSHRPPLLGNPVGMGEIRHVWQTNSPISSRHLDTGISQPYFPLYALSSQTRSNPEQSQPVDQQPSRLTVWGAHVGYRRVGKGAPIKPLI